MVEFDYLRQISHSTSMLDVLEYYNIEYHNAGPLRYKCICPFHDDHSPSLIIYSSTNNLNESYCCYVDNTAGDPFHFIRKMEYDDFNKAWSVLCHINKIEDVDASKIDHLDLLFKTKDLDDRRQSNTINRQISTMYRDLYKQKKDKLSAEELSSLAATIDRRLYQLDTLLSTSPPYVLVHNFYKEELQHFKQISNLFKT